MAKSKVKSPPKKTIKKVTKTKVPSYKKVKTILISQPNPETERNPYSDLSERFKVKIHFRPFIVIEGIFCSGIKQQERCRSLFPDLR